MSRTKNFLYNSVSTGFYQVLVMLTGFITPKIMLHFYGSEINGLVSSINQFIIYFSLVESGLSGAAIYALYKPLAENNYKAINGVISAAKKFYTQSGYMFVSLTIGLAFIYPMFVKSMAVTPLSVGLLVLVLGVNGSLEFFTLAKYRALLTADQKGYIISIASIVEIVISTLLIVILANLKVDIVTLRFVALFSIFIRSFILMIYAKKKYKYINYKEKPDLTALNKRWDALYLQILGAIQIGAPIVIITLVCNDLKLVSVFAIYYMVIAGVNGILSIFVSGLSASFGNIIARKELNTLQNAYKEFEFSYYSLITIVYATTFVTIMPFIRLYTIDIKDINYDLPILGFLFVLNGLLYNIKTPQGMLVIAAGMYKETKVQTTIQGAITVIGGVILTLYFGMIGVLIASILSNIYRSIDLMCYIPRSITMLSIKSTMYRINRIFLCIFIIYIPFLIIKPVTNNYLSWLVTLFVIMVYSLVVAALSGFLFDRQDMWNIARRVNAILKKRQVKKTNYIR
ncbi:lipopolysaccharide biosynthesis protein [Paenibacillus montanisoli]|uniref:Sugar isomerase n=1 Tax=Paenibacillus montanisoli TaxID=2081970 RepID=A0A328U1W7_9BACL|nr:hypothetical protein [Paenibacillus montanisoli]RAP74004.1 hypothetical protein DL346_23295 [Paenibacillus montanisoli]